MAGVVIAAAAGGAPRSHGTVPLRPGYTPPPSGAAVTVPARTETSRTMYYVGILLWGERSSRGLEALVTYNLEPCNLRVRYRMVFLSGPRLNIPQHSGHSAFNSELKAPGGALPVSLSLCRARCPCVPFRFVFRRSV